MHDHFFFILVIEIEISCCLSTLEFEFHSGMELYFYQHTVFPQISTKFKLSVMPLNVMLFTNKTFERELEPHGFLKGTVIQIL